MWLRMTVIEPFPSCIPLGTTLHAGPTQRAAEQNGQHGGRGLLDRQDQVSLLCHSEYQQINIFILCLWCLMATEHIV